MKQIYKTLLALTIIVATSATALAQCPAVSFGTINTNGNAYTFTPTPGYGLNNTYYWNFGDGGLDTTAIVGYTNHTFATYGTYNVCMRFTNLTCDTTVCNSVVIAAPCSITPSFTYDNTSPMVVFTANPAFGFNNDYIWNYGDGMIDTTPFVGNTTHAYALAGTYNVCLKVQDNSASCSQSLCQTVIITSALGIKNQNEFLTSVSCFPNPFNGSVTLNYTLTKESIVEVSLYDVLGNLVEKIESTKAFAGMHTVNYNNAALAKGIYTLKITTDGGVTSKLLIKE